MKNIRRLNLYIYILIYFEQENGYRLVGRKTKVAKLISKNNFFGRININNF